MTTGNSWRDEPPTSSDDVPWTPPPEEVVALDRAYPGFIERWMLMTERGVEAALRDREARTEAEITDLREVRRLERRAQDRAWWMWFTLVVLTALFIFTEREVAAIAFGTVAALVMARGLWRPGRAEPATGDELGAAPSAARPPG